MYGVQRPGVGDVAESLHPQQVGSQALAASTLKGHKDQPRIMLHYSTHDLDLCRDVQGVHV